MVSLVEERYRDNSTVRRGQKKHTILIVFVLFLNGLFLGESLAQPADDTYQLNIPSLPIGQALAELARASGRSLIAPSKGLGGLQSRSIVGVYTVSEALDELLSETNLSVIGTTDKVIAISAAPTVTTSNREGDQAMKKVSGKGGGLTKLLSSVSAAVLGSVSAGHAQSEAVDRDLDTIVVVGSSIGVSQDSIESQALAIDAFSAETLELSGDISVETFLRNEPAFRAGQTNTGNSFSSREPFQTLDLRGIGPEYTLTLINGRRFGIDGPANVDMVPFRALERIEVLKAGASSIYGSDAVAGVVNLVTKKEDEGAEISVFYGAGPDGYDETEVNFSLGGSGNDFSYFVIGSYTQVDSILRRDKGLTNDQRSLGGFDFR